MSSDLLEVGGSAGHLELASLRLYNPESHQWSLNTTSSRSGEMTQTPDVGEFKDGRGEFYDQEDINGRTVIVRFVITVIDADTVHFEQAFSADYGKTWELNWIATDTRMK